MPFSSITLVFKASGHTLTFTSDYILDLLRETVWSDTDTDTIRAISYNCEQDAAEWGLNRLSVLHNVFKAADRPTTGKPITISPRKQLEALDLRGLDLSPEDRFQLIHNLQQMTGLKELNLSADPGKTTRHQIPATLIAVFEKIAHLFYPERRLTPATLSPTHYLISLLSLPLEKLALKDLNKAQTETVCRSLASIHTMCTSFSLEGASLSNNSIQSLVKNLPKTHITHLNLSNIRCTEKQIIKLCRQLSANRQRPIEINVDIRYFKEKTREILLGLHATTSVEIKILRSTRTIPTCKICAILAEKPASRSPKTAKPQGEPLYQRLYFGLDPTTQHLMTKTSTSSLIIDTVTGEKISRKDWEQAMTERQQMARSFVI